MTGHRIHIAEALGQRRERPRIAVHIEASVPGETHTFDQIAAHVLSLARERDWQLISLNKFEGRLPPGLTVRGAIVSWLPDSVEGADLRRAGVPAVRIGRFAHPDDHAMPAVMVDRAACGRLAAEHLAERGFRNFAFIVRHAGGENRSLADAFAARARELGIACHVLTMQQAELAARRHDRRELVRYEQQVVINWLCALPMPVGLLAIGDTQADRFIQWAIEAGRRVPEDIAVMGIGNREFACESALVPVTSIEFDPHAIAETAVSMLTRLIAGESPAQTTVAIPPAGVVTRHSTDVLAASDPNVVRALRFMWDHVTEDLSVDQIAEHVDVSRRKLEIAFKRDLGRGINAELQRRRMDKAREMILRSDLSINAIAGAFSFSSSTRFGKAFRSAFGLTPTAYRARHASNG